MKLEGGTFTCPIKAPNKPGWRCEYQEGHEGHCVQHVPKFPGKSIRIWGKPA